MESGLLKDKITFQKMIVTVDQYGHEKISHVNAFQTRANVKWNGGERVISNEEIVYDNTLTFQIRRYCPVIETMIILYKNKKYRIITVNREDRLNDKIEIIAEEINQ